jgi:hypothetical protein
MEVNSAIMEPQMLSTVKASLIINKTTSTS